MTIATPVVSQVDEYDDDEYDDEDEYYEDSGDYEGNKLEQIVLYQMCELKISVVKNDAVNSQQKLS